MPDQGRNAAGTSQTHATITQGANECVEFFVPLDAPAIAAIARSGLPRIATSKNSRHAWSHSGAENDLE